MSCPAQTKYKTKRKQSKYVVNLSLDIPLTDRLLFDRPVSGQFTISPTMPKKNMKLRLGSARTVQEPQSRRVSVNADCNSFKINSARNDKKITNKSSTKCSANPMKHTRNLSTTKSKSPSRINYRPQKEGEGSDDLFCMQALKNKIIYTVDDDIMGYTNPSAELKIDQKVGNHSMRDRGNGEWLGRPLLMTPPLKIYKSGESQDTELLSQIKRMEKNAEERKKQINMEYMRQKILITASARKIQRAWRNYKTKKLLHTYSQTFSKKSKSKLQDSSPSLQFLGQKKILNVKSCGFSHGQNELKKKFKKELNNYIEEDLQQSQKNEIKKQLQLEEIKKWEELIKELRKSKDVESILHRAQSHKEQLQGQREREREKREDVVLACSIDKIEDDETKRQIQEAMQSLESASGDKKWMNLVKVNTFQLQCPQEQSSVSPKSEILLKIPITIKQEQSEQNQFVPITLNNRRPPVSSLFKANVEMVQDLVFNELIDSIILGERERLLGLYLKYKEVEERKRKREKKAEEKEEKAEGICTNMQSIKDYLQNLISFIFEQYPQLLLKSFNKPINPPAKNFLQAHSKKSSLPFLQKQPTLIQKDMFELHWHYASQQIYFQQKHQDAVAEGERVRRLKEITRTYFQAIFDGFNQCLAYERVYGLRGQPYPWQIEEMHREPLMTSIQGLKPRIKAAFKRLSQIASIFCGMLTEDKCKEVATEIALDIKQERMNIFLEYEVKNDIHWQISQKEKQRAIILLEVSREIGQFLVREALRELIF